MLRASLVLVPVATLCCGSPEPGALSHDGPAARGVHLQTSTDELDILIESTPSSPFAGVASVRVDAVGAAAAQAFEHELRYDYGEGLVVRDHRRGQLAPRDQRALLEAAERLSSELALEGAELPLPTQMAFAALVSAAGAVGTALGPVTVTLREGPLTDKSLDNDGVGCLERGGIYPTSYDHGSTTVVDEPVTADSRSCNGLCGPGCTRLTPWSMWTLDCLEHDRCCTAIGDDTTCWTPLGECGDEYVHAETDFLRGFDPFKRHCGG